MKVQSGGDVRKFLVTHVRLRSGRKFTKCKKRMNEIWLLLGDFLFGLHFFHFLTRQNSENDFRHRDLEHVQTWYIILKAYGSQGRCNFSTAGKSETFSFLQRYVAGDWKPTVSTVEKTKENAHRLYCIIKLQYVQILATSNLSLWEKFPHSLKKYFLACYYCYLFLCVKRHTFFLSNVCVWLHLQWQNLVSSDHLGSRWCTDAKCDCFSFVIG